MEVGDEYSKTWHVGDDESNIQDSFSLYGEIVHHDVFLFIVLVGKRTNAELLHFAVSYEEIKERYPDLTLKHEIDRFTLFMPLAKLDEEFLYSEVDGGWWDER